jgi:hypothetical protein
MFNAAFAASKTCDNDPVTSGCSASYDGNFEYLYHGASWNDNIRIQYGIDYVPGNNYEWQAATSASSNTNFTYYAYLNNIDATATVDYYADYSYLTTLDQDTAPAGWSPLGMIYNDNQHYVRVNAGFIGNTAADATMVEW